jgi:DNA-binding MarR family transcriptional regulator
MSDFKPTLTDDERAFARALMTCLEQFTYDRQTMPLQYVISFLRVCSEEGHGSVEYAKRAGISPTVMTRHLLDIGERNRARGEGFGWITQERDKFDLRRHAASVTPVGRALLNKAKNAMMGFAHRNGSQSSSFVDLLAPERPEQ